MADKWMDERDRRWRERDWRTPDADRQGGVAGEGDYPRGNEGRSFGGDKKELGARRSGPDRDRVFGEEETGASYARRGPPVAGGSYGKDQGYRGSGGAREAGDHGHGRDWQGRDYGGVSPAMAHGEYEADRGGSQGPRFRNQDYTQGGRFYGDDDRQRIYREEYGQGGVEYGRVPRGYDAERGGGRQGGAYGGGGDDGYRARPAYGGTSAGGTGGYDYDRGYGDGGRGDSRGRGGFDGRGDDFAQGAREGAERAGDFLQKAGQKMANWIRGDHLMEGSGGEDRSYRTDFGRERRYETERGHRGLGPKGYKRSDERISDEVHERLTDDSWLDASNIDIAVSDAEVTLSGTVESREAKHRAERLVEDLSGVAHVQNNLRIATANPLTGSGRGFGDSAAQAQMRKDDPTANGSGGAAGTTPGKGSEH